MSSGSSQGPHGPAVADHEDLYRGITTPDWWVEEEKRPSSAAFRHPDFSTDVVALAGSPAFTLGHLPTNSGLIQFNSGAARGIGFNAHLEPDPEHPENHAHANVYSPPAAAHRKKAAQKLVKLCTVVVVPTFLPLM
jgi:hypothetical protein